MNEHHKKIVRHQAELAEATEDDHELKNMEQEGILLMNSSKKLDSSLDLSVSQSDESSNRVQQENIGFIEENVEANKESKKFNGIPMIMSKEELKIRRELEIEIEKDLEEEIKDNICQLAFRLHRLYQHQNERNITTARDHKLFANGFQPSQVKNGTLFSEMNITIKMEGGSKIEIKEIKKGNREKGRPPRTFVFEYKQGNMNPCTKKFKWEKTLRSSSSTVENKKPEPRSPKRKSCNMDSKSLELGWKS